MRDDFIQIYKVRRPLKTVESRGKTMNIVVDSHRIINLQNYLDHYTVGTKNYEYCGRFP